MEMKKKGFLGRSRLFMAVLSAILFAGMTAGVETPVSATDNNGQYQCAFGFCYAVTNNQGGTRTIWLALAPVQNLCYTAAYWISGVPHSLGFAFDHSDATYQYYYLVPAYSVYYDATVTGYHCDTGEKVFTRDIRALNYPDAWI
jgi:hypothetical protein